MSDETMSGELVALFVRKKTNNKLKCLETIAL